MTDGRILGRQTLFTIQPEALGKYADCFYDTRSGLWYASIDADGTDRFRPRARRGALPRPEQDTPGKTAQVYGIHQRAARRLMMQHLRPRTRGLLRRAADALSDRFGHVPGL